MPVELRLLDHNVLLVRKVSPRQAQTPRARTRPGRPPPRALPRTADRVAVRRSLQASQCAIRRHGARSIARRRRAAAAPRAWRRRGREHPERGGERRVDHIRRVWARRPRARRPAGGGGPDDQRRAARAARPGWAPRATARSAPPAPPSSASGPKPKSASHRVHPVTVPRATASSTNTVTDATSPPGAPRRAYRPDQEVSAQPPGAGLARDGVASRSIATVIGRNTGGPAVPRRGRAGHCLRRREEGAAAAGRRGEAGDREQDRREGRQRASSSQHSQTRRRRAGEPSSTAVTVGPARRGAVGVHPVHVRPVGSMCSNVQHHLLQGPPLGISPRPVSRRRRPGVQRRPVPSSRTAR